MKTLYKITNLDGTPLNRADKILSENIAKRALGGSKQFGKNCARSALRDFDAPFFHAVEDELGELTAVAVNYVNLDGQVVGDVSIYRQSDVVARAGFEMTKDEFGVFARKILSRSYDKALASVKKGFDNVTSVS